jgi:catechol 2,3-dioxygenase-like lactoylglutathione lyase family enzyme
VPGVAPAAGDPGPLGWWQAGAMASPLLRLDHVQLAMPAGREPEADAFYVGVLGMEMRPKPQAMAARGGRWYAAGEVSLHLGVDPDFHPARKAHPALVVDDLDALAASLADAGIALRPDTELAGVRRGFVDDPFGNRIELIEG